MSQPIETPRIRAAKAAARKHPSPPAWPSFEGKSKFVGASPGGRVTIFVDPSLGSRALQNAKDLASDADRVTSANDSLFGTVGGRVNVIVFALGGATDGTGGADHLGCDFKNGAAIEVCASYGRPDRVSALFEAELSECSMNGNVCGESAGEALSRWCAAVIGNDALADFATAPIWAADGMPDFVNRTDPTDQNADSTGCGMAFLSWLISEGHGLENIAPELVALGDEGTLAQLYARLTSDDPGNAWTRFENAIHGLTGGVTSDDPFAAITQARQKAELVAAEVRAGVIPLTRRPTRRACVPGSRRLRPPRAARKTAPQAA